MIARAKGEPVSIETIVDPRSRAGRGRRRDPGVRGVPHRPPLPRGRDQRRLPVPARPRGGRRRRVGRRRRHQRRSPATSSSSTGAPCAARAGSCLRGRAVVLLHHVQRDAEDDADRRHRAVAGARHRRVRRQDARRRRPVHEGRPVGAGRRGRPARLRRDGRASARRSTPATSAAATRWPCSAAVASAMRRSPAPRSPGRATIVAVDIDDRKLEWAKEFGATHTCQLEATRPGRVHQVGHRTATAPTCASRRSATPPCTGRRSRPATWPARSCWSACHGPT